MSKKVLGLVTPTLTTVVLISLLVSYSYATGAISNDGWAMLGIMIISLLVYGIIIIVYIVIGYILHYKKHSEFGKWLLNGTLTLLLVGCVAFILIGVFA